MLTKLLSRRTCAACRACCTFDRQNVWETPILSEELRRQILAVLPDAEFVVAGQESYRFRMQELDRNNLASCPLLDSANGCMLGSNKPFDCQIWPFRVMELDGRRTITIAPVCGAMTKHSLETLLRFLKEELAENIFSFASAHPDVVQQYDDLYLVLMWEPHHRAQSKGIATLP